MTLSRLYMTFPLLNIDFPWLFVFTEGDNGDNGDDDFLLDQETEELLKLADNFDLEEQITVGAGNETDTMEDDNDEGWVDECEEMTEEELNELEQSIQPVRLLLTKVSKQLHNTLLSNSGGFSAVKDRLHN